MGFSTRVTLTPFAPRSPFELWILPKEHSSSYIDLPESRLSSLAAILEHFVLLLSWAGHRR